MVGVDPKSDDQAVQVGSPALCAEAVLGPPRHHPFPRLTRLVVGPRPCACRHMTHGAGGAVRQHGRVTLPDTKPLS